jgi:DedD protein
MKRRPRADEASKSEPPSSSPVPTGEDAVGVARTRARRRLIGATVLLVIGIVGFPIIFETQPRPIAVDIPIEITRKDGLPPLSLPARSASEPSVAAPAPAAEVGPASAGPTVAEAVSVPAPPIAASTPALRPQSLAASAASASLTAAVPAAVASAARAPTHASLADDGARASALLEGLAGSAAVAKAGSEAASDPAAPRYVVQFGAYADANAARDARAKVEKLGLKTYAQVIEASAGKRTRVRVGPFANRADADKAAARIEAAGMTANVLTL